MKRELDHLARFLHMAVDYAKEIGFNGQFYIEPKPKEPTKHQYDSDAAACLNFLRAVRPDRPLQAEHRDQPRHARRPHDAARAGSTPAAQGVLGSIDANTGDLLLGWDTDQFPTDIYLTTQCMLVAPEVRRLHHRRRQLRRQGPPRKLRAGRPVPRPHRRHGRLRPRPEDRRAMIRRRQARRTAQRPLRQLGHRPRRGNRSRQAQLRVARKDHARKRRRHPQPQRPAGDDRESDQYVCVDSLSTFRAVGGESKS